jgi:spore maturation protein CgeB
VTAGRPLDIVIFGLALTSAWGNGHATTYRALIRALAARGHRVRFFERDVPWYAANRDLPEPPYCQVHLYSQVAELEQHFPADIPADLVILGSFVPQGAALAEWILPRCCGPSAFYDIDTPVTLAKLERGECEYLNASLIPRFDLYLSFSGGPILRRLRSQFGALRPRAFYCSVEPRDYYPVPETPKRHDLGYLGTYSADRQPALERLLVEPARQWSQGRFAVAGAQYPDSIQWPVNVKRVDHLPPTAHRDFYNSQRVTLNITRADMLASGYSPSVRLFEAAACGVPIMTDEWNGLDAFFKPGREILTVRSTREALSCLRALDAETLRLIGSRARARVLTSHTAAHRAQELENHLRELAGVPTSAGVAGTWTDSTTPVCAT